MSRDYPFSNRSRQGAGQQTDQPVTSEIFSEDAALRFLVSHALARDLSISKRIPVANSAGPGRLCVPGPTGIIRAYAALVRAFRSDSQYHLTLTREGCLKLSDGRCLDYMVHVRLNQPVDISWNPELPAANALPLHIHGAASQLTDCLFTVALDDGNGKTCNGSGFISFGHYQENPQHRDPCSDLPPLNLIA